MMVKLRDFLDTDEHRPQPQDLEVRRVIKALEDKVIIVTGGAGHLGSAICSGIADTGGEAIAVGRTAYGPFPFPDKRVRHWKADANIDISDSVNEIIDYYGHLDGLVNIVGDVQLCTEAVKDHVSVIANCTSLWSTLAPNPSMYLDLGNEPTAAMVGDRAARLSLTRYYASFLAPKVRVNAFSPGWFPKKRGPDRPDYIEQITSRTPLGRIGVPDDIVGTVLFLLSDASRFMTGQNLVVDGGYSIW